MKKAILILAASCLGLTAAAQVKPDLVRSPNGPNTIVDWNVKFKSVILPAYAGIAYLPVTQDGIGRIFVSTNPADKHVYVKMSDNTFHSLANVDEIPAITNTAIKLAGGSTHLGDADPNHTDEGYGGTHTITLGVTLADANYIVVYSVHSLSENPQDDLYHQVTVRAKTTTSFDMYFREAAGHVQDITLDWIILKL